MAKAKSGGTRALLRGRVASDVYSIGKDASGRSQQIVRSLAESVKNPQTTAQMRGRMIMSTVMQALSALRPVVDHSFDDKPAGQPCISEFVSRNYALIKADAAAHPGFSNKFGLNKYQEKGAKAGEYVVAAGSAVLPSEVTSAATDDAVTLTISGITAASTLQNLADIIGITGAGYLTSVAITAGGAGLFARVSVKSDVAMDEVIKADTIANFLDVDANTTLSYAIGDNGLTITLADSAKAVSHGVIKSVAVNGSWNHSTCTLANRILDNEWSANVALPTYPVGTEQYLNGGEL